MYIFGKIAADKSYPFMNGYEAKYKVRIRLYLKLMLIDCAVILIAFGLSGTLASSLWLDFGGLSLGAMILPIYIGVAVNGNAYTLQSLKNPTRSAMQVVLFMTFAMLTVQCVLYFAHVSASISRLSFGTGVFFSALLMAGIRHPFSRYALRRTGGQLTDELVILDDGDVSARDIDEKATIVDARLHDLRPDLADPQMLHRLGNWMRSFDRVIIACPPERHHAWSILMQGSSIQGEILPSERASTGAIGIGRFAGRETYVVSKGPLSMANRLQKRLFDLAVTVPAIIILGPLLILIAVAIKLDSPGPVLFRQERVGLGNRLFKIAKFRSMRTEQSDATGAASASRTDDRITRVGRIIRRTSIDELPQLFNVLIGDMSIVGPRPHALGSTADARLFWQISEYYWCRHALKPGITGLAQIRGYRGATETALDLENRLKADLEYLKSWSLGRELAIVLHTFKVLVHKNAY